VNRVLDFARTDKEGRETAPLGLEPVLREVVRDFGPYLEERGFSLDLSFEDERLVMADADAVKQILLNLLENAVKYAGDAGDRTIALSVEPRGDRCVLSVADHGPGVAAAERDRIFEDFYRPGEELTRVRPGSGIGLALVRRLSEAMGAFADVRDTPGGGATFRVHLRTAR
jgi:signal transduction histidine kinase